MSPLLSLLCGLILAASATPTSSEEKKGLQVQMVDDAIALGIRHAAINISVGETATENPGPDDEKIDGTALYLRSATIKDLDQRIGALTSHGIKVYAILIARATGDPKLDALTLHPAFDPKSPNRMGAFRVTDPTGVATLSGFCRALANRYRPGGEHGTIGGWIVGNEVDSHYAWFSMGPASLDQVADVVERSLRTVDEAVSPMGGSVFISLDHFWTMRFMPDHPELALPSRDLIDKVAELSRRRGDFSWNIAYHPYPENLFDCRFWNDKTATLSFDSGRVTFKNLEVLTEYLKRPSLRYRGRPRRVILSEQGFHRPDGPNGETIQAAAYAYAWNRVIRNDGIDAFILHRHVDHAQEGGLRLGLWTRKPDSIADPDRKTKMWYVMQAAGTPQEADAMWFALSIVGLTAWHEAGPKPVIPKG